MLNNNEINLENGMKIILPPQIKNARWKMTPEAIENTMSYIFDKLRHPCYMVGVRNHKVYFYKLHTQSGTSPDIIPILKQSIYNLNKNPFLTKKQQIEIKNGVNINNTRIMQCVLKTFADKNAENNESGGKVNEYYTFLKEIEHKIGNGLFILNLTDAIILREDGNNPFPFVYGLKSLNDTRFTSGPFLPIMGAGQYEYMDIPIPNYDEIIRIVDNTFIDYKTVYQTKWNEKNPRAIFRGGSSGCGATGQTNARIALSILSKNAKNKITEMIDSCIVGNVMKTIKYDPVYGLTKINKNDIEKALCDDQKGTPMTIQSTYKYIIHIDGNVNAYRLLNTMLTGSLILRVKSPYIHWADYILKPNVHYIEIAPDLSNIENVLEWCLKHDRQCEQIAHNAMQIAPILISKTYIQQIFIGYMNFLSNSLYHTKTSLVKRTNPSAKTSLVKRTNPSAKTSLVKRTNPSAKTSLVKRTNPSAKTSLVKRTKTRKIKSKSFKTSKSFKSFKPQSDIFKSFKLNGGDNKTAHTNTMSVISDNNLRSILDKKTAIQIAMSFI